MNHSNNLLPYSFADQLLPAEMRSIKTIAHEYRYQKGEYVFQAEQSDQSVYIVMSGKVKISRISTLGHELIQWFCMPGDIFGVSGENHFSNSTYAKTLSECVMLRINKHAFNQLMLDQPRIGLLVIDKLSARIHTLGDMILYMASDDANTRFIKLLQYLIKNYGQKTTEGMYIDIPTTHQDMADMIGTCRQTVSHIIGKLKRSGTIRMSRNGIHIDKPQQLSKQSSEPMAHSLAG